MRTHRSTLLLLAAMLIVACSCPVIGGATGITATETAPAALATDALVLVATDTAPAPTTAPTTVSPPPAAGKPQVTPNGQAVNCRSGPGTEYPVSMILQPGQTATVAAKSADGGWWQINNPALAGNLCWVSAAYVTASGDLSGVGIAAAPPTPVAPPTSAVVTVTNVSLSVSPKTIGVAGCMGPIQPSTVTATIEVNGPIKLHLHFQSQQNGSLGSQTLTFNKAGSKVVSDTFTPPLTPGKFWVELIIDGMNLKGFDAADTYKISC